MSSRNLLFTAGRARRKILLLFFFFSQGLFPLACCGVFPCFFLQLPFCHVENPNTIFTVSNTAYPPPVPAGPAKDQRNRLKRSAAYIEELDAGSLTRQLDHQSSHAPRFAGDAMKNTGSQGRFEVLLKPEKDNNTPPKSKSP